MTKTPTICNYDEINSYFADAPALTDGGSVTACRVEKHIAEILLFRNISVFVGGNVRYYQIKHIGLGVYEIKLRPEGKVNTYMVDSWEPHSIGNTKVY